MKTYSDLFQKLVDPENLFKAFFEFRSGKSKKPDVIAFEHRLEENLFALHRDLKSGRYRHGGYEGFYITDPKQRHIHKATVRDRVVHHAAYAVLDPLFEETFIFDSYSCRVGKGTHKGVDRLRTMLRRASRNNSRTVIAMKCDVRKFFASVDHGILLASLAERIHDPDVMRLLTQIVESFQPGLPIGNLTSQMFANFYMNPLDRFVKHDLRAPFYLRYTDDFILISHSRDELEAWLKEIRRFLKEKLKLELHPHKVSFHTYAQGVDFLGYVQFPHHRLVRTKTKDRMLKKLRKGVRKQAVISYLGVLSHADAHELSEEVKSKYWVDDE